MFRKHLQKDFYSCSCTQARGGGGEDMLPTERLATNRTSNLKKIWDLMVL